MTSSDSAAPGQGAGVYPILRLIAALLLMTVGGSAMFSVIVVLKPVGLEFGVSRGIASFPYMFYMLGFGFGGRPRYGGRPGCGGR